MVLDLIINAVDSALGWIISILPDLNINLTAFTEKFQWLIDLTKSINFILPIKEAMFFLGVLLGIKFAMLVFWAAMRVVNLLRGSG